MADGTQRNRTSRSREQQRASARDRDAGRRLSLAMEMLGEALNGESGLPARLRSQALALAEGRSTVPARGVVEDHVARLRRGMPAQAGAMALEAWLGDDLAQWFDAYASVETADALEVAVEARRLLMEPWEATAHAYGDWFAAGLADEPAEVFRTASRIALGEACDRWCALGNEGDIGRCIATWQRSASGWAESLLGLAVDVSIGDIGRLRELSAATTDMSALAEVDGVSASLAARLGWPRVEVERLLKIQAAVHERRDARELAKRRWSIVGPIARAVSTLERELGRMPTVAEVSARAGVLTVTVELALDALGQE